MDLRVLVRQLQALTGGIRRAGPYTVTSASVGSGSSSSVVTAHGLDLSGVDLADVAVSGGLTAGLRITWYATVDATNLTVVFGNPGTSAQTPAGRFIIEIGR